jgi:hypothetical protein
MTIALRALVEIIGDDPELIEVLYEVGVLDRDADTVEDAVIEAALVTRTLVRELEVNPPGVEIILRMRQELLAHRRQVAQLLALLRSR